CSRPPCGPSRPRCPTPPPAPWTTSRPWWSSRRNRDPVHRKRRRRRCRCARPAPERSADHVDPSTVSLIRHRRRGKIPADREAARAYAGQPRRCCRLLLPERTVTMPYSSAPSPFSPAAAPEVVTPPSAAAKPRLTFLGTGYLGATYAICLAELGYEVPGVDVDAANIAKLAARGRPPPPPPPPPLPLPPGWSPPPLVRRRPGCPSWAPGISVPPPRSASPTWAPRGSASMSTRTRPPRSPPPSRRPPSRAWTTCS